MMNEDNMSASDQTGDVDAPGAVADDAQAVSCMRCKKYQPENGKLLHCLHVVCDACLKENVTRTGTILCLMCKATTSPRFPPADLIRELADCAPFVYGKEDTANGMRGVMVEEQVPLCDVCVRTMDWTRRPQLPVKTAIIDRCARNMPLCTSRRKASQVTACVMVLQQRPSPLLTARISHLCAVFCITSMTSSRTAAHATSPFASVACERVTMDTPCSTSQMPQTDSEMY